MCSYAWIATMAALLAGCSNASQLTSGPSSQSAVKTYANRFTGTIVFHGERIEIGSAAAKARAISRAHPLFVFPSDPLFVADPSLNGVMFYDATATGANITPYGILAGSNTQLSGPVAVTVGTDLPCPNSVCTPYLWVSNAGNNTITQYTLPLTTANQAPVYVISWNGMGSCGPAISNPYGIVHYGPFGTTTSGTVFETSETVVTSSYYIVGWTPNANAQTCDVAFTSPNYDSPSGPSIYSGIATSLFNANRTTVSSETLTAGYPPGIGRPAAVWSLPRLPATEGTAVQSGTSTTNSYVWVTTSANSSFPNDALWRCQIRAFGAGRCATAAGGGRTPVCVNPSANLAFPAFPATSATTRLIYVPNSSNGTVTAYKLRATCRQKATYVNTVNPFGVAVQI